MDSDLNLTDDIPSGVSFEGCVELVDIIKRKDEGATKKEVLMGKFKGTRLGRRWREKDEVKRRRERIQKEAVEKEEINKRRLTRAKKKISGNKRKAISKMNEEREGKVDL